MTGQAVSDVVVPVCRRARPTAWLIIVIAPAYLRMITFGLLWGLLGVALTAAFVGAGVRGLRARVVVAGGRLVVANSVLTSSYPVDRIEALEVHERRLPYSMFFSTGGPYLTSRKESIEITLADGRVLIPEALRRPFGSGEARVLVDELADAIGLPVRER